MARALKSKLVSRFGRIMRSRVASASRSWLVIALRSRLTSKLGSADK